jgi:hypothetical protein
MKNKKIIQHEKKWLHRAGGTYHVGLMVANQLSDHWRVMLKTRKMRGTTIKVSVEWKPYYKNKYNVIVKSKREEL